MTELTDAELDRSDLVAPLSDDDPCGPDLDLEGDPDFMNYMARAEGLLPARFFEFDRSSLDLPAEIAAAGGLIARTRDVRLLSMLAKFAVLNRDLKGFARHVAAIADLLETRWETVNPRDFDGDWSLRLGAPQSLDDPAPSVLPLQHVPLVRHGRIGPISFRAQLVAAGDIMPREGEEHPDAGSIDRAMGEVEIDALAAARDLVGVIATSLTRIRDVAVDRAGYEQAPKFERLGPLVDNMLAWLDGHVAARDPSRATQAAAPAADGETAGEPAAAPGEIAGASDVSAALAAIESYFVASEPSNPALLLIRQAGQLVGKSFIDAMRILAPGFVDQAAINIGRADTFALPLERLSEFASVEGSQEWGGGEAPRFDVRNRTEAIATIAAVIAFYGRVEPSSPIPFLLERARSLAGRDFISILKDLLPENTLRNPNSHL
ncbi:MAG: type VI secretion system ImpA family N-terminal domain-containing protein [Rhizobiales bacterium]|nr:type VI secretion system ImpA family N-terminal domain-containing protein [Hyphomicrobiales bacterium]